MLIPKFQADHDSQATCGNEYELPSITRQSRSILPEHRDHRQNIMKIRKTKSRKKTKPPDILDQPEKAACLTTDSEGPSQQDLLTVLMFRIQQDKHARDAEKALRIAKDAELDKSKLACKELEARLQFMLSKEKEQNARLQSMISRGKEQDAQLSKYQKALPGWKSNIQKLQGYLQGLTNDHNKLRDDAKVIQKQQESLQNEASIIHDALKETHAEIRQETDSRMKIVTGTRRLISDQQQILDNRQVQLDEKADLLHYERERNQRLEDRVSITSQNHQQVMDCIISYRKVVSSRLDDLLKASQNTATKSKTEEDNHTKSMLNQCLVILGELGSKQSLKLEDLHNLDSSIHTHIDRYAPSLTRDRPNPLTDQMQNFSCFDSGHQF